MADIETKNVGDIDSRFQNEIYHGKAGQLRQNNFTRGVIGYRIVYGTRVLYY